MSREPRTATATAMEITKDWKSSPMRRRRSRFSVAPTGGPTREELLTRLNARGVADRVRHLVEERLAGSDASHVLDVEAEARCLYEKHYPADSPAPDPREAFTTIRERLKTGPSHTRFLNEVEAAINDGNLLLDIMKEEVALAQREFIDSQLRDENGKASEHGPSLNQKCEPVGNVTQPKLGTDFKSGQRPSHEVQRSTDVKPSIPADGRASTLKAMVKAKVGADAKITEFLNTLGMSTGSAVQRPAGVSSVGFKQTPARRHTSNMRTSGSTDPSVCSASLTDTRRSQDEKYCTGASDMPEKAENLKHSTLAPAFPVCDDGCAKESKQLKGDTSVIAVPATMAPSLKSSSRADACISARSRAGSKLQKSAGTGSCFQSFSDRSDQAIQAKGASSAIVSRRNVVIEEASSNAPCAQEETCYDPRTGLRLENDANSTKGSFEVSNVALHKSTVEEMPQRKSTPTAQVTETKNLAQVVSNEKILNTARKDISKGSLQSAGVCLNDGIESEANHSDEKYGNASDSEAKRLASKHVVHLKSVPNPLSFTGKPNTNPCGIAFVNVERESALSTVDVLNVALDSDTPTKFMSKSRSYVARISSPTKTVRSEKKSDIEGSSVTSRMRSTSEVPAASRFSSCEPSTVDGDDDAKVVVEAKCAAQTNADEKGTEFAENLVEIAAANAALGRGVCAALRDGNCGKASTSGNSMAGKFKTTQGKRKVGKSVGSGGSDDVSKRHVKNSEMKSQDDEAFSRKSNTKIDHGCSARIESLNADTCDFPGGAELTKGVTEQSSDPDHGKRKRREGPIVGEEAEQSDSGLECGNEDGDVEGLDRVREVLEQIRRLPEASPFLEPVDSSAPGCETYYGEIEHPRNLGTICGHLGLIDGTGYYKSVEAVVRDVNLVWSNCFQFNPSRDRICDLARICKTKFELLMERTGQVESNSGGARKSHRSTQGIHTRLLSDDRSVVALRRQKRMKRKSSTAASTAVQEPARRKKTGVERELTVQPPQQMTSPGAELVGHSLLVFCGLTLPGTDSEAVRWHHCTVLEYHEDDRTHDVLWVDFTEKSRHLSFAAGSDYCIFKDRGLAS